MSSFLKSIMLMLCILIRFSILNNLSKVLNLITPLLYSINLSLANTIYINYSFKLIPDIIFIIILKIINYILINYIIKVYQLMLILENQK